MKTQEVIDEDHEGALKTETCVSVFLTMVLHREEHLVLGEGTCVSFRDAAPDRLPTLQRPTHTAAAPNGLSGFKENIK